MRVVLAILLILSFSQCINSGILNKNEIESKKDFQNIINAVNTVFKLNATSESFDQSIFLQQILDAPDDRNLFEILVLATQSFVLFYVDNYGDSDEFQENFEKWTAILQNFKENGSEEVTLQELKPFFLLISQKNSTFAPIVDAINEYLYDDNLENESFLDLVLTAPDSINLNEMIIIAVQNYFLLPFESVEEKPENYEDIKTLIIQTIVSLQTSPLEVTMKELKPIIEFIWNLLFPTISSTTSSFTITATTSTLIEITTAVVTETTSTSTTTEGKETTSTSTTTESIETTSTSTTTEGKETTSTSTTTEGKETTSTSTKTDSTSNSASPTITTKPATISAVVTKPTISINSNTTGSQLELFFRYLLTFGDELTLHSFLLNRTEHIYNYLESSGITLPSNYQELKHNWTVIINNLENSTESVYLKDLRPYLEILSSGNTIYQESIDQINYLLFGDNSQNFITSILSNSDDTSVHDLLIKGTQSVLQIMEDSYSTPDNIDVLVADWINILFHLKNGTNTVVFGQLRPFIEIFLNVIANNGSTVATSSNTRTTAITTTIEATTTSTNIFSTTTSIYISSTSPASSSTLSTSSGSVTNNTNNVTPTQTQSTTTPATPTSSGLSSTELGIIIGSVIFIVLVIVITGAVSIYIYKKFPKKVSNEEVVEKAVEKRVEKPVEQSVVKNSEEFVGKTIEETVEETKL